MRGVENIVFAARGVNPTDGHWYANFGYYADDPNRKAFVEGAKLYQLNLVTRRLTTLLSDPRGGVRDPQVSYDGKKILFSYRKGGTDHYHLYEIQLDTASENSLTLPSPQGEGSAVADADSFKLLPVLPRRETTLPLPAGEGRGEGKPNAGLTSAQKSETKGQSSMANGQSPDPPLLKQLTNGPFDDIEPTYLPDGDIVFVSSRCKRWVNCWLTQVAVLHRCGPEGSNIRAISSNNEHDNTPWPLADGRILYTRWEYVDRSQVHFHHLWAMNPDGTSQMTWYGNMHPGTTMIDAKSIPGSDKIVASFSPGHGQREHDGTITVVDPRGGPDAKQFAKAISPTPQFRDPWAFSEDCFLAAHRDTLVVMDETGRPEQILKLPAEDVAAKLQCHEPRPLTSRSREPAIQPRARPQEQTGCLLLADVNHGRNMTGVKQGDIKKLLVLETLPMPIHYTGGMEPISYGGTFTLERILGTVPVEADGSAYFEVPALRSVFFVALDEQDLSVKRMQSFTTAMAGETLSCVGCHEHRAQTPQADFRATLAARKAPARIEALHDVQEVFDFPRDIQPVLNSLCADCHGYEKTPRGGPRAGHLILTGDRGPLYSHSYYMMTIARLFSDGRNEPKSNYDPRLLGSSASQLLTLLDGAHYEVKATPQQKKLLRLWIDSGAAYPGTCAALGCGMIGNYAENNQINTGSNWPETQAGGQVIRERCAGCHDKPSRLLPQSLADERGVSFWQPSLDDPRLLTSRHIVFNLSRPEKSLLLLAPLAQSAGGWGLCKAKGLEATTEGSLPRGGAPEPFAVFKDTSDREYQKLLAMIVAGKAFLERDSTRFDMADFRPRADWVREMKRYGILPASHEPSERLDVYAVEQNYWKSLWYARCEIQAQ
jgi:hypothetical protein